MERKRGLITDFDNTLVLTSSFVVDHISNTCRALQISPPSKEKIFEILKTNPPFEEIFERLFAEKAEAVLTKYRETAMDTDYKPISGGPECVKSLRSQNFEIVIVSNRTNKLSERLAQANYSPEDFVIMAAIPPKPSQEAYNEALEYLEGKGVLGEDIFIVGDSLDDYVACPSDLATRFYAVTSGLNEKQEFMNLGLPSTNILTDIALLPLRIDENGRT